MADILNKLNTLVRASIHGVTSEPLNRGRRLLSAARLGNDIDGEIAALRAEVERALDEQDRRESEIAAHRRQIAEWDRQVDSALAQHDEATARHLIRQMQRLEQETTMLEADLDQHRRSAGELISRVNELEALVAEARSQQTPAPAAPTESDPGQQDEAGSDETPLSVRLRQARQTVRTQEVEQVPSRRPPAVVDDSAVEDSLAVRRARLSKPD